MFYKLHNNIITYIKVNEVFEASMDVRIVVFFFGYIHVLCISQRFRSISGSIIKDMCTSWVCV